MVSIGRPSILPPVAVAVAVLGELEAVAVAARLRHDEQAEAPVRLLVRSGSVRASNINTSARAAKVHHVLTPLMTYPGLAVGSVGRVAVTLMSATSLPKSGSVTATAAITSAVASFGSQSFFWASVPPLTSARVRISGRVISDPPMPRLARQLLGGDHHREVLVGAALAEPAVLGGDAEAEGAHLGESGDDRPRARRRWCDGRARRAERRRCGERAERVLHHLHVVAEMSAAGHRRQRGDELCVKQTNLNQART